MIRDFSADPTKRFAFRYSLRTLLLALIGVGALLAWWTRPVLIEHQFDGLTMRYTIRRGWDGRRYYVGTATLNHENGHLAAKAHINGLEEGSIPLWIGDDRHEYYDDEGTRVSSREWFNNTATNLLMNSRDLGEPASRE